jgi:predicted transcriptional regulator
MATYSSQDAARRLGLSPSGLSKYVRSKKIPAPQSVTTGGITVYLWTEAEIEHVRQLLPKIANGRKTRYSKLGEKQKAQPKKAVPRKPKKKK